MSQRHEAYGYDNTHYERPNMKYVCGKAKRGECSCPLGPDKKGKCQGGYRPGKNKGERNDISFECSPKKTIEEGYDTPRWHCTRTKAMGDKCALGPTPEGICCKQVVPCCPTRSLRSKRGLAVFWTLIFCTGLILVAFGTKLRAPLISAGPLTHHHQGVNLTFNQEGEGVEQDACAVCHTAADQGPTQWLNTFFVSKPGLADSQRCLDCHNMGVTPMFAHGRSAQELEAIHDQQEPTDGSKTFGVMLAHLAPVAKHDFDTKLSCSSCHKEHRGAMHDLKVLSQEQCQSCHANTFTSFSKGHPEFRSSPGQINFDHRTHFTKHFNDTASKKFAPQACDACHVMESGVVRTMGFKETCAACHEPQLVNKLQEGIPVFGLPGMDVESLADSDTPMEGWPGDYENDFEGELSPFTQFFVSAKPEMVSAMKEVSSLDLQDLSGEEPEMLAKVQQAGKAMESLFADAAEKGRPALADRLRQVVGAEVTEQEMANLTVGLTDKFLKSAHAAWWPEPDPDSEEGVSTQPGTWSRDNLNLFLRYIPEGHGDPFMQHWLDFTARHSGESEAASTAFKQIINMPSFKACVKCHLPKETASGQVHGHHWNARGTATIRSFTKFNHETHFALMKDHNCSQCHKFGSDSVAPSGFQPRQRSECAACHVPEKAGDSCLLCHHYHVGDRPFVLGGSLDAMVEPEKRKPESK